MGVNAEMLTSIKRFVKLQQIFSIKTLFSFLNIKSRENLL